MMQQLKNIWHLLGAVVANVVFGFPSKKLFIIAITGTDGKTTTSTLTYHILKEAGKRVALISTVAAFIEGEALDTGFHVTNPSSYSLQKLLARIQKQGIEYVVLETTSHGIDQNRNWGIHPQIAAITNVTHEHLDYHKTYENYLRTKAKLLLSSDFSILNADATDSFPLLKRIMDTQHKEHQIVKAATLKKPLVKACGVRFGNESYNYQNTAIAAAISLRLGVKVQTIAAAITSFPGVKGRMEEVPNNKGMRIIVDFAHTPNALKQALSAVSVAKDAKKKAKKGKLIVVFGCAGLRDVSKRPLMADIATQLADIAIFTAEDPRTEDIWSILNQMKSGVQINHNRVVSLPDRKNAIKFALKQTAKSGDTVLVTGKGHEQSMCIGKIEYPWDDRTVIEEILAA